MPVDRAYTPAEAANLQLQLLGQINDQLVELDADVVNAIDRLVSALDQMARTIERLRD